MAFTLSSVVQNENRNLAAMVLSILKSFQDSIKKSCRLYILKNLFFLYCSHGKTTKLGYEKFKLIRNTFPNKSGNHEGLKK